MRSVAYLHILLHVETPTVQKQSLQRVNYEQQFAGNLEGEK